MASASRFDGQLRWLHKVRLYPTCAQEQVLIEMLRVTRELYNAMLQQRRDLWKTRRLAYTSKQQYAEITELRACELRFAAVCRECLDATLHRLDRGFAAFFRRIKSGEEPGYRLRKGRHVPEFGRAFIVTKNGCWYAIFEAHRDGSPRNCTGERVGVDRGIRVLTALSDGTKIANIRPGSARTAVVERHARKLDALTKKDANGRVLNRRDPQRVKAARRLARAKEREANARRDWLHKASRDLVDRYGFIALESLKVGSMTRSAKGTAEAPGTNVRARSGLNRALLDAGFGMLATLIREKAAHAARVVVSVDPKYTSQTCAECAHVAKASREGARFACVSCGHEADADVNAARVILLRAESPPTRAPGTARGRLHDAA
jgi:IS605 OrfB family transposase